MQASDRTRIVWAYLTDNMNVRRIVRKSRREMAEELGYSSITPVTLALEELRSIGHISWVDKQARSITVNIPLYTQNEG